jgi:hypothetical protein
MPQICHTNKNPLNALGMLIFSLSHPPHEKQGAQAQLAISALNRAFINFHLYIECSLDNLDWPHIIVILSVMTAKLSLRLNLVLKRISIILDSLTTSFTHAITNNSHAKDYRLRKNTTERTL